jgi:hypothetical protein
MSDAEEAAQPAFKREADEEAWCVWQSLGSPEPWKNPKPPHCMGLCALNPGTRFGLSCFSIVPRRLDRDGHAETDSALAASVRPAPAALTTWPAADLANSTACLHLPLIMHVEGTSRVKIVNSAPSEELKLRQET